MMQLSKTVRVVIVCVMVITAVVLSIVISNAINKRTYKIEEIAEAVKNPSTTPNDTVESMSVASEIGSMLGGVELPLSGEESDCAIQKVLIVLDNSPFAIDIQNVEYEVRNVDGEFVVLLKPSGYLLYVVCDAYDYTPYSYTCTREFTKEELDFFMELGNSWEVHNEDGTYTVYFS